MVPTPSSTPRRVLTVAPLPPERCAYALARYSRSPDSVRESVEWVRTHDSAKFLESFYFQYGHASIADLGHIVLCWEGVSELAATEIEDEQLWDGQARSSRYQDFSQQQCVVPPEFTSEQARSYLAAGDKLLAAYREVHAQAFAHLQEQLPRPDDMKPEAYQRNLNARAFDIARYLLPMGIPTGVGQVTSIRTLERQIRRLKSSPYAELRELGSEAAAACAEKPQVSWREDDEPVAPTLAKYVNPDEHLARSAADLRLWAAQNLKLTAGNPDRVTVTKPAKVDADIVATLLYPHVNVPYAVLYEEVSGWTGARRREVIDVALQSRTRADELLRGFRSMPYVFDIVMDIGAYRDLHRHRRCQQFRQAYNGESYTVPQRFVDYGVAALYKRAMEETYATASALPAPGREYLLTFGNMGRFLFKMDFAEAEYICRLRSGVKGHFSYREVAYQMKEALAAAEPDLAYLLKATHPSEEDPLKR